MTDAAPRPTSLDAPRPVPDDDTDGEVVRLLDRTWSAVAGVRLSVFATLAILVTVWRTGLDGGAHQLTIAVVESFPRPIEDYRSHSVVGAALARLAGVDDPIGWVEVHIVVIAALVVVAGLLIRSRFDSPSVRRMMAVWVLVSAVPPTLLQKVGSYDVYTALGSIIIVLSRSRRTAVLGGVLIGLTNAEQGIVSLLTAGLVVAALDAGGRREGRWGGLVDREAIGRLVAGGVAVVTARALLLAWFHSTGVDVPSRSDMLGELLGDSLRGVAVAGGAGVFAWFGLAWGVVGLGWVLRRQLAHRYGLVVAALLALPVLVTATTLDGTRVFAMVSLPALLVLLARILDRAEHDPRARVLLQRATAAVVLVAPLVPALITDPSGGHHLPMPWG